MATKQAPEITIEDSLKGDARLDTPQGLTEAATRVFNAALEGRIDPQQGNVLQKLIRGQIYLRVDLPLQYIRIVKDVDKKGSDKGHPMGDVIEQLNKFLQQQGTEKIGQ